jgi:hypothetical protein
MLAGILIFALPITVIGSNYETAYHNEVRVRVRVRVGVRVRARVKVRVRVRVRVRRPTTARWLARRV